MSLLLPLLLACHDPGTPEKPDPGDTAGNPDDTGGDTDTDPGDTDSGDTDTDPGDTDTSDPGDDGDPGEAKGADFFADDRIHTVALELSEENIRALNRQPKTYVEGAVTLDGNRFETVGVRIKGSSTMQTFDGKPSLKIDLNRYVDQDYDGLELVQIHGLTIDTSQLHEAMGWKVAQMAGLPYCRVSYVRLTVNGEDYGLYANVEAFDDEWMDRTWADGDDGKLYEGGYPFYPESMDHADFVPREVGNFDIEEGEDDDHATLMAAVEQIRNREDDDWYGRVDEHLDLDKFAKLVAVEGWIGQWDGYAYAANNFRVYVDTGGQAEILLSGLDWCFTNGGSDWGRPSATLASACRQDEACHDAILAAVQDLRDNLDTDALLAERARIWALIEPEVETDPKRTTPIRTVVTEQAAMDSWISTRSDDLASAWRIP